MRRSFIVLTTTLLLALGSAAHAGLLLTSPVNVLNGRVAQCFAANYRDKPADVEITVICDGAIFLGPALVTIAASSRDGTFGTNSSSNKLCYCRASFKGSGKIRASLQVFDGALNVVERAEAF